MDSRAHHCNSNFEVPPDSTDTWADPNCSRINCLVGYLWGHHLYHFCLPKSWCCNSLLNEMRPSVCLLRL